MTKENFRRTPSAMLRSSPEGSPTPATLSGSRISWFAAAGAVGATYFYFLIFAEFAFLGLAEAVASDRLRWLMGGLGAGGVAGAVLGARCFSFSRQRELVAWAFRACALSALLALVATTFSAAFAVALSVGLSLGWLTVTLTASLRSATAGARLGLCIGAGTGLAYALCNVPAIFDAPPRRQTLMAAALVGLASFAPRWMREPSAMAPAPREYDGRSVTAWVIVLLALVWMDSAAFFIVQHTPGLRAMTWTGPASIAANGLVHLIAALIAGVVLDRGGRVALVAFAAAALALACLILNGVLPAVAPAAWCYTMGVSLYSAALVEYPARSGRAGIAAAVFAIAGWIGSGLGIGMAQDLHRIPTAFVAVSVAVIGAVLLFLIGRKRALRAATLVIAVLAIDHRTANAASDDRTIIARGRDVYMTEGCIHCHSQFIRSRAALDVQRWGPAQSLAEAFSVAPPLFGTRRQGPDLSNVGNRRTPEWNRLHLIAPHEVSPGSRMPSYAHLFAGDGARGSALVAYLASLGDQTVAERQTQIASWKPETSAAISPMEARQRFLQLCAHCHGSTGKGDGPFAKKLSSGAPDWTRTTWRHVPAGKDLDETLSRIIKYGLPGLPMAGHEYLPDADILGLARYVQTLHTQQSDGTPTAPQP